jgi:hypothetical protein
MNQHAELIKRLILGASISRDRNLNLDFAKVADEAADAMPRLTAGDASLPEPETEVLVGWRNQSLFLTARDAYFTTIQLQDYGDRRDASGYQRGVLAERERCMDIILELSHDSAAIREAIRKGTS